jgi:beta-glucanase (GH16 family)
VRRLLSTLAILAVLAGCGTRPGTPPGGSASAGREWVQVWRDDFDGSVGSRPSPANWLYDVGTCYPGCPAPQWGTGEIESMSDSTDNVSLDGAGHLAITAHNAGGQWTSGRIESRRTDFAAPTHGVLRVSADMRLPAVSGPEGGGYWPAFWLLAASVREGRLNWPGDGEIDVMESVNARPAVFGSLHCGTLPDGPCHEASGGLTSGQHPCPDCSGRFHNYAVELDYSTSPEEIRWYLDGGPYFTVTAAQVDPATWHQATRQGFVVILDLAIGGAFPAAFGGGPTAATVPGRPLLIDDVTAAVRAPTAPASR